MSYADDPYASPPQMAQRTMVLTFQKVAEKQAFNERILSNLPKYDVKLAVDNTFAEKGNVFNREG